MQELQNGLSGLLGKKVPLQMAVINGTIMMGQPTHLPFIRTLDR